MALFEGEVLVSAAFEIRFCAEREIEIEIEWGVNQFNLANTSTKNPSIRENANQRLPKSFNEAPR